MTSSVRAHDVRRRGFALVGALAVLMLVAGGLPWVSGGSLTVRLIGLPLVVAGLLVGLVGYRLRRALLATAAPDDVRRDPAGCGGCACGGGGCGADPAL